MRSEPRRDEGFTLIEMMVALAVLSVAMAGVGTFFISGSKVISQQRDHRQASQVASSAIEQVRALQNSALIEGRGQTEVDNQIKAAREGRFKDELKPYLDSMKVNLYSTDVAATEGADAPISTRTQQVTYNSLTYQQTIYVGACDVYYERNDPRCVNPDTATNVPTDPTEILQYFRVVVLVAWPSNTCVGGQCGYLTSTLISRISGDPKFDFKRAAPEIRDTGLPVFYLGRNDITVTLKATGGVLPNTWTATGLPDGLTIAPDGTVSGTPTRVGTFTSSSVRVTESAANPGDIRRFDVKTDFVWRVVNPPAIAVPAAPKGTAGAPISLPLTFSGGVTPYKQISFVSGQPATLAITNVTATGATITGTATATYTAVLEIEDANGITSQATYTHTILAPLTIGDVPDTKIDLGSAVSVTAVAAGGDGKYTYSATGLPTGVLINPSTGVISGLPLIPGRYLPTVTVKDGSGGVISDGFELVIATKTALNFTSPATGQEVRSTVGQAVNVPVATNADAVNAKGTQITALGLPPGTRFNNGKDAIIGTPTLAGTYLVTMTATSLNPISTSLFTFIWTVS